MLGATAELRPRIEKRGAAAGRLDPDKLAPFGQLMRSNVIDGEVPFRKGHLRSLIDAVETDQHVVRIHGSGTVLERAVLAPQAPTRVFAVLYGSGAP